MRVTAAHIRSLLDSPADDPVLHIERDENTGTPTGIGVWAAAYVPHGDAIAHRGEVLDAIGGDLDHIPDADDIAGYLPYAQDVADQILADTAVQ